MSGAGLKMVEKEYSEKRRSYVLKEAGLAAAQTDRLQGMPWKEFHAIATRASQKLNQELGGGGARPRRLSTKMAGALLQFMKTGTPDGGGLPAWPRYTSAKGETMILDDTCVVKNDSDREARKALPAL